MPDGATHGDEGQVFGRGRLGAVRQLDVIDMNRRADVQIGHRRFDRIRDRVRRNQQFDRVLDDVDRAAALHAGGFLLADHVHRNHDLDRLALGEPQEIHVDGEIANRVELVIARDGAGLLAVDLDLEDRGEEVAGEDQPLGFVEIEGDSGGRLTGSIDHRGYFALASNGPGGPLAAPVARHGRDLLHIAHGCGPFEYAL